MRFSWIGGFIQSGSHSEGAILQQLGILRFTDSSTHFDVDATYLLREMFSTEPPMEELYPLLIEFTMRFKFPKMVNRADIEGRLCAVGMTRNGLDRLNLMLRGHYRIWDSDF